MDKGIGKSSRLTDPGELSLDLNGDGREEFIKAYEQAVEDVEKGRNKPIILKIFSGTQECPKEEFSFQGVTKSEYPVPENEVVDIQINGNFFNDGKDVLILQSNQYGGGSGWVENFHFFVYENGAYREKAKVSFDSDTLYQFYGMQGLGTEIISAIPLSEDAYHFGPHYYRFVTYTWNGTEYIRREEGITKNKYDNNQHLSVNLLPLFLDGIGGESA